MKRFLLLVITIAFINGTKAQTYDTNTYYGKMAYTFNNLNKTQITTGLLRDYGIDFTSPDD